MSTKGIHDIIGCYKGKFVSFEVKLPTNKDGMSTNQVEFMSNVHKAIGFSFEVRCLEDVKNFIRMIELSFIY